MNPLQQAIHCYQLPNQTARDNALEQILSKEENRKMVELWIKNHPVNTSISPMLKDLRNRVQPAQASIEQTSIIEEKILSVHFNETVSSPNDFIKEIELIKTHLELKTLTIKDVENVLPLLLDRVSTQDIIAILKAANSPLTHIPPLSKSQKTRLNAILMSGEVPQVAEERLPLFMKIFIDTFQKKKSIQDIKKSNWDEEEKYSAIANFIERNRLSMLKVKFEFHDEEFLQLAPYLRFVDFRSFNNIKLAQNFLKNCANLNVLFIDNSQLLEGISELPYCQMFNCASCTGITALPELPLCQDLVCSNTPLTKLPDLPLCQRLECNKCNFLTTLPALPLCQHLSCKNCSHLVELPALPLCHTLECDWCSQLRALPPLPLCQKLDCAACNNLTALNHLPLCQSLDCNWSVRLTMLPDLPLCTKLVCYKCEFLTALPALPQCKSLDCSNCPALTEVLALPVCEMVDCRDCTSLSMLPALPRCQKLYCNRCPLMEFPEITYNAHVVSVEDVSNNSLPFSTLNIHIEKFTSAPIILLIQLGDHLLINKPFPNIFYFEKGERNQAIDVGGVRRDFVTKLCLNLFKEKGLKLEDNFPIAASNEEKAYRTLGCLLAHCYPEKSFYKTGPLFDPGVYQCMLAPNPGSIDWFLTNYLTLINAHESVREMLFLSHEVPHLDQEDLTQVAYLAEPDGMDLSKYDQHFFDDPKNRTAVSKEIVKRAKQDPRLKAISWMAQELRKRVPVLAHNLQERVEGILNKVALKRKLKWEFTSSRFHKTQGYLSHWIDNHEEKLEKFVYAVTGNRTLCADDLKIQVFDRDKNFIPVAHTCFFSLELSGNYESQEVFDQKIDYFLENALEGSGFTAG